MLSIQPTIKRRLSAIERICQTEVGRKIGPLAKAATGELERSAYSIAEARAASVVVLTGAYIPWASPGAAETDGPPGASILATGLQELGIPARLLTDSWCLPVVQAAGLAAGGLLDVDCADGGTALGALVDTYAKLGVTHLVSVERMGRAIDGRVRNFRGEDVTRFTSPLDALMNESSWTTVGIGDGGNELGMGKLPRETVATVSEGARIHCVTGADALIVAGVSNWGALALLLAASLIRGVAVSELLDTPPIELHQRVVDACVEAGAVDGTTGRRDATVDGLPREVHELVIGEMLGIAEDGQ